MQTLPLPRSHVHFDDCDNLTGFASRGGHMDEATAVLADPGAYEPSPAEWAEVEALMADQTISEADAVHRDALRQLRSETIAAAGVTAVHVERAVVLDDNGNRLRWSITIHGLNGCVIGVGYDGREALVDVLDQLDRRYSIAEAFGGFTLPGVCTVLAFPTRTKAEALTLCRRIALQPSYLSTARQYGLPGIVTPDTTAAGDVAAA
jgi:hypothetical protein